jgi:undecaprenyl diphosphate synthase
MPRTLGHRAGVEALRGVVKAASDIGIGYLTLYAFSTENWSRPEEEVSALMQLLVEYLKIEARELHENNVKITTIGDLSKFPPRLFDEIKAATTMTESNKGLCLNIALNYGGRDELVRAFKKLSTDVVGGKLPINSIDASTISTYLDTAKMPDPELLIRTSGEYRISNFLLWQTAYTEFYFTNTLWPDFDGEQLIEAIRAYQKRNRRFGSL